MTPADKSTRDYKWIALTPRFTRNDFAGYNQKDGSHIYDDAGKTYFFVPESAYLAVKSRLEKCEGLLREFISSDDDKNSDWWTDQFKKYFSEVDK